MMIKKATYHHSIVKELVSLVLVALLFHSTKAQDLTNGTNLYIPAGLEVHLDGDFANSGFIQNQGSFYVTGNWRNTKVYQGTGKVILSGDRLQNFANNNNAVHDFVIDGLGVKNIINTLPVTNRFDLFLGVVNVTDDDTLLLAETATVGGGSIDSYVNGALTYAGTGYKFFPIGKNGNYHPVEMLNITGINPVTELEVFENLQNVNAPPSITLYPKIYWERKAISGTFISSPLAIGYQIPDDYTNRHQIEIVEGDALDQPFTALDNVIVEYGDALDKIISEGGLTKKIFVIGESIPIDGIPGEFYLSTSLSPDASNPDNRYIKVFGNQLVEGDFQFIVYNRWGLIVYENRSLQSMIATGWDGRHKGDGNYLPAGAYPFFMKAITKTGEVIEKKGTLSIVN